MNAPRFKTLTRRDFIRESAAAAAGLEAGHEEASLAGRTREAGTTAGGEGGPAGSAGRTSIAVIRTTDRKRGVEEAMKLLKVPSLKGKRVLIKPNFNTADPPPGSTHNDTLAAIVGELKTRGPA